MNYESSIFEYNDGSVGWYYMTSGSTIDVYKIGPPSVQTETYVRSDAPDRTVATLRPAAAAAAPTTVPTASLSAASSAALAPVSPGPVSSAGPATQAGFEGNWNSWWGQSAADSFTMTLQQHGDALSGSYDYNSGTIQGRVTENNGRSYFEGTWRQTNSSGWFRFELSDDGESFEGTWGYTGNSYAGGYWNGYR